MRPNCGAKQGNARQFSNPQIMAGKLDGDDNHFYPIMTTESPAPKAVIELVKCGCKKNCSGKCGCFKNKLRCTELCGCNAECKNKENQNEYETSEDDISGSESD